MDFPIVFSYTRAQALADGILVDITRFASEHGYKYPVATTIGLWGELIDPKGLGDPSGTEGVVARIDAMLCMAKIAITKSEQLEDRIEFSLLGPKGGRVHCWVHCGPGDDAAPVLTFMLRGED